MYYTLIKCDEPYPYLLSLHGRTEKEKSPHPVISEKANYLVDVPLLTPSYLKKPF